MLTAKLFVPLGAPDQASAGETFLPVQSKPLNTCSSAIFPPGFTSGLVSVIALDALALASPATVAIVKTANLGIQALLPSTSASPGALWIFDRAGHRCKRRR